MTYSSSCASTLAATTQPMASGCLNICWHSLRHTHADTSCTWSTSHANPSGLAPINQQEWLVSHGADNIHPCWLMGARLKGWICHSKPAAHNTVSGEPTRLCVMLHRQPGCEEAGTATVTATQLALAQRPAGSWKQPASNGQACLP
jgi:hypothetical protein